MAITSRKMEPEAMQKGPGPAAASTNGATQRPVAAGPRQPDNFGKKILLVLGGVFLVYSIVFVGTLIRNNIKKYYYIGMADQMERTITVTGSGRATGKNDIAMTTVGYSTIDKDVAKAQTENKKVMDQVTAELVKIGIDEKDMQTNYNIYPEYDYTSNQGQVFKGYRVHHSMTVKIRDLAKITDVLNLPAKYGATEVGGLSFTIDDNNNLKDEARQKALADAKAKASNLAKSLGVALGEVVSYGDYEMQPDYPYYPMLDAKASGLGGQAGAPVQIAGGSKDVNMNVSITYKIYPRQW